MYINYIIFLLVRKDSLKDKQKNSEKHAMTIYFFASSMPCKREAKYKTVHLIHDDLSPSKNPPRLFDAVKCGYKSS